MFSQSNKLPVSIAEPGLKDQIRIDMLDVVVALVLEIPYIVMPQHKLKQSRIYILGDSLTAGLGEAAIEPYPTLINKMKTCEIVDLSIPGSKMKDGLDMARAIELDTRFHIGRYSPDTKRAQHVRRKTL